MNDPAVEAADRAWTDRKLVTNRPRLHMEVAAREALKPIQDLHRLRKYGPSVPSSQRWCSHCKVDWPCDTAKLIYPENELA